MTEAKRYDKVAERLRENEIRPAELLSEQEAAFARDVERLHQRSAEFVEVDCPACGSALRKNAFEKYGFTFLRCGSCATLYMSPRPSEEVMADYYRNSENYAYWAKHIFPASEDIRREKIHKPWLARVVAYCDQYCIERGTMVEIGPGFGTFSSLAIEQKVFKRVVAIEPTPELAEACRRRGMVVFEKRVEDLCNEVADADVVVAFEVIEHLFEPSRLLSSLYAVLRPGGLLVLSCPNGEGFDVAVLGPGSKAVDAEHVNLFNPASLGVLVRSCGFEVLEVNTPGRLDAEFVHDAIVKDEYNVSGQPFLQRVLVDEWERLGGDFQQFLAEHQLSSHMWLVARKQDQP
ncbi:MAG: class I SAM-dependent methyltransferase [Deltaproteobacteria bacterium]|nr:class I SAM-dependent methyltransferase [Deltaproteobacteria bacterium]